MPETRDFSDRFNLLHRIVARVPPVLNERFRGHQEVRMKDGNDPVTETDLEIDALVSGILHKEAEGDVILTEETSDGNFEGLAERDAVWVLDPLDGTKNYANGIQNYACGIAFVSRGQPQSAAIVFPDGTYRMTDVESYRGNAGRLSPASRLSEALIGMDLPKKAEARKRGADIASKLWGVGVSGVRCMGSAVADCWRVSDGQLAAYLHTGLQPWDIAAPAAFILTAGGRITRLDGSPWNVFCPDVLASNGHLHDDLLKLING